MNHARRLASLGAVLRITRVKQKLLKVCLADPSLPPMPRS